ncbi:MAG: Rieske (2Fe-2S) protein [Candidatus Caldarchaeum sp.]
MTQKPIITEVRTEDFEALVWNAYSSVFKGRDQRQAWNCVQNVLTMLEYVIYCLMHASVDAKEVADDPYLYDRLGKLLTYLTKYRRQFCNLIEIKTDNRPKHNQRAYEAYLESLKEAENMADLLAACRAVLRFIVTAARAAVFYMDDRQVRELLLPIIERDDDYNTYMEDFIGRYVKEPDIFQPSLRLLNVILPLSMGIFPHEGVETRQPKSWIPVCDVNELLASRKKLILLNGWMEVLLVSTMDKIFAVENLCTHEGGFLHDGFIDSYSVSCIDHLAKFDVRSGRVLTQPHHGLARPIATFPVKVENGKVLLGVYTD